MAQIQHLLRCDIDPTNPVPELSAVIGAVLRLQPERGPEILNGLAAMIENSQKVVNEQDGK